MQLLGESGAMTVALCRQTARQSNLAFFGVQNGDQCFGGNDLSKFTNPGTCYKQCAGDAQVNCGGPCSNQIYTTGAAPSGV